MMRDFRRRLAAVVAPTLLMLLPLCLFGPHTIFSGNEAEFSAPFWALIRPVLFAGGALALGMIVVALALPDRFFRLYVALLFGLGLVLWIQGNFLVANYGAFTGAAIDWSLESWRNPYEIALWVAVPALTVAASRYVFPIAPFASGMLVAVQAIALATSAFRADAVAPARWRGPAESMFELSTKQNILHIVLDGFQSDFFADILAADRQRLDRSFSGAVFFADHVGAFPTTIVSMPAMLTGKVYRNERPLQRYMYEVLKEGSLFTALRSSGYRVDTATGMHHGKESATNYYHLPRPYVSYDDYRQFTAWQLADLSLFRHAPHMLRPAIYNEQSWRLQSMFGPGDTRTRRHHPVNGAVVLDEFARRFTTGVAAPVYKYIHVGMPHQPVALDGNCAFIGVVRSTAASYREQARCAVMRTAAILDRLKALGVYDNTFVVISSDHGIGFVPAGFTGTRPTPHGAMGRLAGKAMALLVVKPLNAEGAVRTSHAPTTITDIPATVLDGVGVARTIRGEPALQLAEGAPRVRSWAMYDWDRDDWSQNYFEALDILEINGRALDGKSWKLTNTIYSPNTTDASRTRGLYEVQRSRSGVEYRWSGPDLSFHVAPRARSFEMTVRSIAPKPQTVTVWAGDHMLGRHTLGDRSWLTIKHPLPPPELPDANWVHVTVDPPWRTRGSARVLGVQTRDVIFGP